MKDKTYCNAKPTNEVFKINESAPSQSNLHSLHIHMFAVNFASPYRYENGLRMRIFRCQHRHIIIQMIRGPLDEYFWPAPSAVCERERGSGTGVVDGHTNLTNGDGTFAGGCVFVAKRRYGDIRVYNSFWLTYSDVCYGMELI